MCSKEVGRSNFEAELSPPRKDVARERANDRRRIAALEREEPQPMQKDRAEIPRALLMRLKK